MDGIVTLSQLSARLGLDRSNTRKWAIAQGFGFVRVRTPESRGQLTLAVSAEDAAAIEQRRASQGFGRSAGGPVDNSVGHFYALQIVPDLDAGRIKLGFASALDSRLSAHRTAAPTAILLGSWPCRRSWESAALASVAREGCKAIGQEVFSCDDTDALIARAAAFFALMPTT